MIEIENAREFPTRARGAYATIGNFDGVHLGHQRILGRLRALADQAGAPALALTFHPHPAMLLRPDQAPTPLVWPEREARLLKEAGATEVGVFKTGPWLLSMSAREFFTAIVRQLLSARGLVEGPNFAFGHDRQGDVASLRTWCAEVGMDFETVDAIHVGDELVSSSRIRASIQAGRVREAATLLGRAHRLRGVVVRGAGRGAGLGFPTANLDRIDVLAPGDGVYAALAFIKGEPKPWPAACNLGPNPTFGESARKLEAHLIGFHGDLVGQTVELDFLDQIRPTRKFPDLQALLGQIAADVETVMAIVKASKP